MHRQIPIQNMNDFYESLRPLVQLLTFFGYPPYQHLATKRSKLIYWITTIVIAIGVYYTQRHIIWNELEFFNTKSKHEVYDYSVLVLKCSLSSGLLHQVWLQYFNRTKIENYLTKLNNIFCKLNKFNKLNKLDHNSGTIHRRLKRDISLMVITKLLGYLIEYLTNAYGAIVYGESWYAIIHSGVRTYSMLAVAEFWVFIHIHFVLNSEINSILINHFKLSQEDKGFKRIRYLNELILEVKEVNDFEVLDEIMELYFGLNGAYKILNRIFRILILNSSMTLFFDFVLVNHVYFTYNFFSFWMYLSWQSNVCVSSLVIVVFISRYLREHHATKLLLHRVRNKHYHLREAVSKKLKPLLKFLE